MKYLITSYKNRKEKQEIENDGLYCYDLRHNDNGIGIATIEKSVSVNRVGSIITNKEIKFGNKSYNDFIDFKKFSSENQQVDRIEQLEDELSKTNNGKEEIRVINGYKICKDGSWCEVTKNGHHVFDGNIDKDMSCEQIYQEIKKEVVFSLNGKELLSYDMINECSGERKSTIEILANKNNCREEEIEVSIRKPKLNEEILKVKFVGIYNWDRPVFKDEKGTIFKDINLGHGALALTTSVNNEFYGEPDSPIHEDIKIEIVNSFNEKKTDINRFKDVR